VLGLERPADAGTAERERIVEAAAACDLFVNDRPIGRGEAQLQLLFRMAERWRGEDKTIVNLGSRSGERSAEGRVDAHAVYQRALDAACQQLFNRADQRPRVVNIRTGPVAGDPEGAPASAALDPDEVARAVLWVLEQPPHVYVSSVTLERHATDGG
jgi:NADP-dependent 3-hydroxy acid dehydrogenase YdfG